MRYQLIEKFSFNICVARIMREHEESWAGPDGIPITVGTVKVEDPNQMVVKGKVFDNNAIDKDNFKEQRKILNGNTQRRTVAGKSKKLALNMQQRCYHMEKRLLILIHIHKQSNFLPLRKHALIFRLCVHELDGSVCDMCKKTPHKIPPEVVKDLPKRSQGGLFWDITLDPNLPGSLHSC